MTSAIGITVNTGHALPAPMVAPQIKSAGLDSDGDNDGSKVNTPAPTSHLPLNLGSRVNTTA